jgi:hypothetical protein
MLNPILQPKPEHRLRQIAEIRLEQARHDKHVVRRREPERALIRLQPALKLLHACETA